MNAQRCWFFELAGAPPGVEDPVEVRRLQRAVGEARGSRAGSGWRAQTGSVGGGRRHRSRRRRRRRPSSRTGTSAWSRPAGRPGRASGRRPSLSSVAAKRARRRGSARRGVGRGDLAGRLGRQRAAEGASPRTRHGPAVLGELVEPGVLAARRRASVSTGGVAVAPAAPARAARPRRRSHVPGRDDRRPRRRGRAGSGPR